MKPPDELFGSRYLPSSLHFLRIYRPTRPSSILLVGYRIEEVLLPRQGWGVRPPILGKRIEGRGQENERKDPLPSGLRTLSTHGGGGRGAAGPRPTRSAALRTSHGPGARKRTKGTSGGSLAAASRAVPAGRAARQIFSVCKGQTLRGRGPTTVTTAPESGPRARPRATVSQPNPLPSAAASRARGAGGWGVHFSLLNK